MIVDQCAVHRNQHIEPACDTDKQFAVPDPGPANQRNRFYLVTGQVATQPPVEILIEENPHLKLAENVRSRLLEHSKYLFAFHAGEPLEKFIDGVARRQVIE